jgi:hypothetical protein
VAGDGGERGLVTPTLATPAKPVGFLPAGTRPRRYRRLSRHVLGSNAATVSGITVRAANVVESFIATHADSSGIWASGDNMSLAGCLRCGTLRRVRLCGRQVERAVIAGVLEGARASRSGAVVLQGPPGVGKSALLEDAAGRAEGMLVLRAGGVESEAEFAFAGLHQLLLPVLCWLDRIPDHLAAALRRAVGLEPAAPSAGDDRFLVALAVLALVAEVAEQAPLLCLVDDAHWLDDASAMALVFVARRLAAERVAVVFAIRDGETRAFPAAGLPRLRLQGVDGETAGELLAARGAAAVSVDVRDRLVEWTGGNPLALVELPYVLTAGQLAGHEPLPSPLPLTATVQRVFAERARRLPEPCRRGLLVAAAEETGRLPVVLAAAEALGVRPEAFDGAERAGLIRVRDGILTFDHPLMRSAVYQSATSAERRRTHAAVAGTPHVASDLLRRAWHLALAAAPDDEKVVTELEDAARHTAERGGFAAAAAALERAAELTTDPDARGRRLVAAAQYAWQAGLLRRVADVVRAARPLLRDLALRAQLGMLNAMVELSVGSPSAALRILTGAARDAAAVDPPFARRALAAATEAAWLGSDGEAGVELRSLAMGLDPPVDEADRFFADLVDAFLAFGAGDLRRAFSALNAAVATAVQDGRPELLMMVTYHVFYIGDDHAARRLPAARVAAARSAGPPSSCSSRCHRWCRPRSLAAVGPPPRRQQVRRCGWRGRPGSPNCPHFRWPGSPTSQPCVGTSTASGHQSRRPRSWPRPISSGSSGTRFTRSCSGPGRRRRPRRPGPNPHSRCCSSRPIPW